MKGVFVSDCEGPISKNDNAYELTEHYVPDGNKLFSIISKYDDILADILKKPGYNAGDTLKLVLPFLLAYEVTDEKMLEFSKDNLRLISGTKETLRSISEISEAFIVSTSYEHYIKALCEYVDFSFERTYCTRLAIDRYAVTTEEKLRLKTYAKEISSMSMIAIPAGARSIGDFSDKDQGNIKRLDQIFWSEIPTMKCGNIFSDVAPVGGEQKAYAIRDIARKTQTAISNVMYVGDSITDVQAFQLVRESGGLTISFNGNAYAVKNAEVSILSDSNIVTAVLTYIFFTNGKSATLKMVENWNSGSLRYSQVEPSLLKHFQAQFPKVMPKVQIVTEANMESLSKESSEFRKQVRGEAVGRLG